MDTEKILRISTILLALTAGYCDTVTFVAVVQLFSAHVTGNFIVLAYDIVKHADSQAWIKLLTFPVFTLAVVCGGWITAKSGDKYRLLITEGVFLIAAGLSGLTIYLMKLSIDGWQVYLSAMFIVFAMGLQNAFGKLFAKETIGPTTMMTGNVTQAALDLGALAYTGFKNDAAASSLRKQLITIGGFLAGCIAGGIAAQSLGLTAVILPGIAILTFAVLCQKSVSSPS